MTSPPTRSLLVRLVWVALALATFVRAVRISRRLAAVQRAPAARKAPPRVVAWGAALATAAHGLAAVALCNLVAGFVSLWLVVVPPKDGRPPVLLPLLFIASALVKLHVVSVLDDGYRRVTEGRQ